MEVFNGIYLMVPNFISEQIAGDACPVGFGCWYPNKDQYFSSKFPPYLQDPKVPIHLKEFICLILAVKFWGHFWAGKRVQIFCDNDSVCDVITYLKPKDEEMQVYLREFLFWVCFYNFIPTVSKISTKDNDIADFLSRNFNENDAKIFFEKENLFPPKIIQIHDSDFKFKADW